MNDHDAFITALAERDATRDLTHGTPDAADALRRRPVLDSSCWRLYLDAYDAKIAALTTSTRSLDSLRSAGLL